MNEDIKEELACYEGKAARLEKDILRLNAEVKDWTKRIVNEEGISSDEDLDEALFQVRKCLCALEGMENDLKATIEMQIKLLKG